MSKKKNMGLKKFHWFKVNKTNLESKSQYFNWKKSKEFLTGNNNHAIFPSRKSFNQIFSFNTDPSDNDEKNRLKLHLLDMLDKESDICNGSDFLYNIDRLVDDKVDASLRDEAVKHLQIMNKVYFELPFAILCNAVQLIDRFISRVKVRPKYMFCASAVCYQMVVKQYNSDLMYTAIMTDLPTISRSGGTAGDFTRMEDIIRTKLFNQLHTITVLDFVHSIINYLLINNDYSQAIMKLLEPIMETAITNYCTGYQKPSILAISCIMVYNNWYPHQPICSPWSLLHLTALFRHDWSIVLEHANFITELHNNRINLIDSRRTMAASGHRKSGSLSKSIKHRLDTIIEE